MSQVCSQASCQTTTASPCTSSCDPTAGVPLQGRVSSASGAATTTHTAPADTSDAPSQVGHSRTISSDPDYEVPAGILTQTQVLKGLPRGVVLDRFGFVLPDSLPSTSGRPSEPARGGRHPQQRDARHVRKWRKMLGPNGSTFDSYVAAHPAKVKRRARKGIPEEFRGLAWHLMSGGRTMMLASPGIFQALQGCVDRDTDTAIMRDLNRTFPNHSYFMHRQGPGQQSLYHVLRAFSVYNKEVGYVQGMGFVTAVLLLYMTEEEAFWTLVALLTGARNAPIEGLYLAGLPLLKCCLFRFQALVAAELPRFAAHLAAEDCEPALYATHWFNTLYAYCLPFEHLLRVWDVFMLEGMKMLFRVGLALLTNAEPRLGKASFEGLVEGLGAKNVHLLLPPKPKDLVKQACKFKVSKHLARLQDVWHSQQLGNGGASHAS